MKRYITFLACLISAGSLQKSKAQLAGSSVLVAESNIQSPMGDGQIRVKTDFRVVGYYQGDLLEAAQKVDFSKITHLNIAFINPDSNGVFPVVPGLTALVNKAHEHQVKVLVAIGGGRAPKYYTSLIAAGKSDSFISGIGNLIDNYMLDGIDVDIEGSLITTDYEGFILKLAKSIKPRALLTVAVASNNADNITAKTIAAFDFINIMSYDKTGPWRPQDAGPHAPYEMAEADLLFWKTKGATAQQLNLGVPFYGYAFNAAVTSMTFRRLLTDYPGSEKLDELDLNGGGKVYYNGIPTIKKKTQLALQEAGGIMIWQLAQDAEGKKSLLRTINAEIKDFKAGK